MKNTSRLEKELLKLQILHKKFELDATESGIAIDHKYAVDLLTAIYTLEKTIRLVNIVLNKK